MRFFPFLNWKTGLLEPVVLALRVERCFNAENGQKLLFFISKRSTKSPEMSRMTLADLDPDPALITDRYSVLSHQNSFSITICFKNRKFLI